MVIKCSYQCLYKVVNQNNISLIIHRYKKSKNNKQCFTDARFGFSGISVLNSWQEGFPKCLYLSIRLKSPLWIKIVMTGRCSKTEKVHFSGGVLHCRCGERSEAFAPDHIIRFLVVQDTSAGQDKTVCSKVQRTATIRFFQYVSHHFMLSTPKTIHLLIATLSFSVCL